MWLIYVAKEVNSDMTTEIYIPESEIISLTESAQQHFNRIVADNNSLGVKLSLKGGGCAGFSYDWQLVSDITDIDLQDHNISYEGWDFWLDHSSIPYLTGSVVDYIKGIAGQYIDIKSPLAASSCGCGESVSFSI